MSESYGRRQSRFPRTKLGRLVADGAITLDGIFESGKKIKESEIVDKLVPNLQNDVILIGGSPGKGGGIRRTPTRRTARMHRSGRRYRVSAMVVVGDGDGHIGLGAATSKEHRHSVDKALEQAKLNIMPVKRGCGSWECSCNGNHSIPVATKGKAGSVRVTLMPAPKGIGLCVHDEAKKVLRLAGIKDIWTRCSGQSKSRNNYVMAMFDALRNINSMKSRVDKHEKLSVIKLTAEEMAEIEKPQNIVVKGKHVKEPKAHTPPVSKDFTEEMKEVKKKEAKIVEETEELEKEVE